MLDNIITSESGIGLVLGVTEMNEMTFVAPKDSYSRGKG